MGSISLSLALLAKQPATASAAFVALGQSATVAAETTALARTVATVRHYDGNVWIGYGDYSVNTGPCDVLYWDGSAFQTALSAVATDALYGVRVAKGDVWLVVADPKVGTDPDYVRCTGTACAAVSKTPPAPWHLFDVYEHADGVLYLAGAHAASGTENTAAIWRSTDNGAAWTLVDSAYLSTSVRRNYTVFHENGYFWTQVNAALNARRSADGVTWEDAGFRVTGSGWATRAVKFDGDVAVLNGGDFTTASNIVRFDGTALGVADVIPDRTGSVYDACAADGYLYALTSSPAFGSELWRKATWAGSWARVAALAGNLLRSLDVHDGTAWAGGTDSRLYAATGLGTAGTIWVDARGSQWTDADGNVWVA